MKTLWLVEYLSSPFGHMISVWRRHLMKNNCQKFPNTSTNVHILEDTSTYQDLLSDPGGTVGEDYYCIFLIYICLQSTMGRLHLLIFVPNVSVCGRVYTKTSYSLQGMCGIQKVILVVTHVFAGANHDRASHGQSLRVWVAQDEGSCHAGGQVCS